MKTKEQKQLNTDQLDLGRQRLKEPVLPLVSMVQFLFLTGPFATVAEVIAELPAPIETAYCTYEAPQELLAPHLQSLQQLEGLKGGSSPRAEVVDTNGEATDAMSATSALVMQQVLTEELAEINSLLCAPCNCRLCCIGPGDEMSQEFFEIPLRDEEKEHFHLDQEDSPASRAHCSMDEEPLLIRQQPFYRCQEPTLIHWRRGWSLILPRESSCPQLESEQGRCQIYSQRPEVCRRPQIFPYILEELEHRDGQPRRYRLRQTLLAVIDCPYVDLLREEIAAYGAACELEVIFKQNKA